MQVPQNDFLLICDITNTPEFSLSEAYTQNNNINNG